jgi:hypothetical protein
MTMARCLDGEMRDAFARQRRQILVKLDGIGRRQAAVAYETGRDDTQRADARGR